MIFFFRPHHFLCTLGFQGKGYSPDFVENYIQVKEALQNDEELPIHVIPHLDSVCTVCPHNQGGICATEEKIRSLDNRHSRVLGLASGDVLTWGAAKQRIKDKMTLAAFHEACKGCQWKPLGICEKALKIHRGEL